MKELPLIKQRIKNHDLIIGGVLLKGAKAPKLITKDMLKLMRPGTVLVDVAVDQGGCIETSKPTTHQDPIYIIDDIVHYCVANMPGAVPYTSTLALTNVTLPYILKLANNGWETACEIDKALAKGYYKECFPHKKYACEVVHNMGKSIGVLHSQTSGPKRS